MRRNLAYSRLINRSLQHVPAKAAPVFQAPAKREGFKLATLIPFLFLLVKP